MGVELEDAINDVVHSICANLLQSKSTEDITTLLRLASQCFLDSQLQNVKLDLYEPNLATSLRCLQRIASDQYDLIKHTFYTKQSFRHFSDILLSGILFLSTLIIVFYHVLFLCSFEDEKSHITFCSNGS